MSRFKEVFTVKQHTPMIHFQSEQKGATLRATELKPKLDSFLKEYKIIEDKDALDYKVKIEPDYSERSEINQKNSLYFAIRKPREMSQQEYEATKKFFKKHTAEFKISFFSYNKEILESIKSYFSSFMVVENFGTRQNKGFGSFYLSREDKYYIDPIEALNKIEKYYIYANYSGNSEKVQAHVEVLYPLMKTGINFPDHPKKTIILQDGRTKDVPDLNAGRGSKASYYKSYLFAYLLNQNISIGNEKRFIKENFFDERLRLENDGSDKKYVRALLGIGDGVEFKDKRRGTISYDSTMMDRFKSPITFKIIENIMFIIANDIPNEFFNTEFTFSHSSNRNPPTIFTPNRDDFDLSLFLGSFAVYFNNLKPTDKNFFDKKIIEAKKTTFKKAAK